MLDKLTDNQFFKNSTIDGVYCFIQPDGEKLFRSVTVYNKKGKLSFDCFRESKGELATCAEYLSKSIPVFLVLDGKGILHKKIVVKSGESIIKQIIPNAQEDEFVVDPFLTGEETYHVAIMRNALINEILDQFKSLGINVVGLSIGPYRTANLFKYFPDLAPTIIDGNYQFEWDVKNNYLVDVIQRPMTIGDEKYRIDSNEVPAEFLSPLCVALAYYIEKDLKEISSRVIEQKKEYLSGIVFQKSVIAFLVLIFLLLITNFMFYMHYTEKVSTNESLVNGNKEIFNKLDTLKKEVEWKEKFLKTTGIIQNTRIAFYADRIAETVPEEIQLSRLDIHPLVEKVRKSKEIVINPNIILVEGVTKNSVMMNDWVHDLKELKWIGNVAILNYSQEDAINPGIFSIELQVNQLK